jgi:hypothetical protein
MSQDLPFRGSFDRQGATEEPRNWRQRQVAVIGGHVEEAVAAALEAL